MYKNFFCVRFFYFQIFLATVAFAVIDYFLAEVTNELNTLIMNFAIK